MIEKQHIDYYTQTNLFKTAWTNAGVPGNLQFLNHTQQRLSLTG
jgi:hypothetical protein